RLDSRHLHSFPTRRSSDLESFRVILGDAELAGESERPLPVDRGEVDRLGAGSHVRGDLVLRHVEDERRRLAMNVPALLEGLDERDRKSTRLNSSHLGISYA